MGYYFDIVYNIYTLGFIISDYLQCILGAVLRSVGLEKKAMVIYIIGFYFFGIISLIILVGILDLNLYGVWFSLIVASGSASLMFAREIKNIDWNH
jgi:Na+-driven multidrug efflux pump